MYRNIAQSDTISKNDFAEMNDIQPQIFKIVFFNDCIVNKHWNYFEQPFQSTGPQLEVENKLLYQLNKPVVDPGIFAEAGLGKPADVESGKPEAGSGKPVAENDKPGVGRGKLAGVEPGLGVGAAASRPGPGEGSFADSFATDELADSIAEGRPGVSQFASMMLRKERQPVRILNKSLMYNIKNRSRFKH